MYFRVARFPEYGRLSGQRPDQVEEQEPNPLKEDGRDFALWKATKLGEDTQWDSPWGKGRPGWHIECSAMAEELLGPAFEIHGGGLDLVFPHHENEVAQSRALGHEFAHIWAHNGMLQFTGDKMSKSVGNIATIREVLDRWGRETALVFFLTGHWRKPIDFSDGDDGAGGGAGGGLPRGVPRRRRSRRRRRRGSAFAAALDDDFNTPAALAVMHGWRDHELLRRALDVFGLDSLARASEAPAGGGRAGRAAHGRAGRARLRDCRPAARRDRGGGLGDARRARRLLARSAPVSDLVYGRRAVREALRGQRQVLELWATERAAAGEPWLAEAKPKLRPERELSELAGDARPPGGRRPGRAVPLRRRLGARRGRDGRCSSCSTASPIRATSAPSAGARSARARPASSCRRTARRS